MVSGYALVYSYLYSLQDIPFVYRILMVSDLHLVENDLYSPSFLSSCKLNPTAHGISAPKRTVIWFRK